MNKIVLGIVTPVIGFGVFLGISILINASSIVIYDNFSENENFVFNQNSHAQIYFRNNSPINIEQMNPIIIGQIVTEGVSEQDCKVSSLGGMKPCFENSIDLGKVSSGESGTLEFSITPNGKNFSITAIPGLNFFGIIPLKPQTWDCNTKDGYQYLCKLRLNQI